MPLLTGATARPNPACSIPGTTAVDDQTSLAFQHGLSNVNTVAIDTSSKILEVISRYRLRSGSRNHNAEPLPFNFLAQIYTKAVAHEAISLCLPAFPFKSPNTRVKVLGKLADKAEEFALAHLNGLCAAIQDIYAPGAKLMIVSDGLVYNGMKFNSCVQYFSRVWPR